MGKLVQFIPIILNVLIQVYPNLVGNDIIKTHYCINTGPRKSYMRTFSMGNQGCH